MNVLDICTGSELASEPSRSAAPPAQPDQVLRQVVV